MLLNDLMTSVRAAPGRAGRILLSLLCRCDPYLTVVAVVLGLSLWLAGGQPWEGWD